MTNLTTQGFHKVDELALLGLAKIYTLWHVPIIFSIKTADKQISYQYFPFYNIILGFRKPDFPNPLQRS